MFFSKKCDHLAGPLADSMLSFVTQEDATNEDGVKIRYISDPMVEIDERIGPKTRHRLRVPKHANAIRRVLYWEGRYPRFRRCCVEGM